MNVLTICLVSSIVATIFLIVGYMLGYGAGKKKRKGPKKLGGFEFTSTTYEQTNEPLEIKVHKVLVEMGEDSNITKQRISIDGISTGIDLKTFVTTNLRDTVTAHLNMQYNKIATEAERKKLEAIGLIKADVAEVIFSGIAYRINFVRHIR